MADFHCAFCGKYGYGEPVGGPVSAPSRPNGWVQNKSWGFGIKYYCSKKCKISDENVIEESNKKKIKESSNSKEENQKTAEQIRVEHEAELERKKIRKETEILEANERKLKAQKYKDKGWIFIGWLIESNPVIPLCLFAYPFLFLFGPDIIKLIGIISILILASLLIKDVAKISWKGFVIMVLLLLGLLIGLILFVHKSDNEYTDDEFNQIESSLNNEVVKENSEIEQVENSNLSDIDDFTEVQDFITVEGISDKIYFYDDSNTESKTKGYFVKGQKATLLGESKQFSKVRFEHNGKVTEKFVLTNEISQILENSQNEIKDDENLDPEYIEE